MRPTFVLIINSHPSNIQLLIWLHETLTDKLTRKRYIGKKKKNSSEDQNANHANISELCLLISHWLVTRALYINRFKSNNVHTRFLLMDLPSPSPLIKCTTLSPFFLVSTLSSSRNNFPMTEPTLDVVSFSFGKKRHFRLPGNLSHGIGFFWIYHRELRYTTTSNSFGTMSNPIP